MAASWIPIAPQEPIGVVALSGPVANEDLDRGLRELRSWGRPLVLAPNVLASEGYLAGGDEERIEGLCSVLDRGARVLIATRGGFGATRLLDRLPWGKMADAGVCFVGFSDLVVVMNPLALGHGLPQVHGPMVAIGLARQANAERLRQVLRGDLVGRTLFEFPPGSVVREGRASGPAAGGNLALVTALLGTPHEPVMDGCVLFLEEVGEPIYRLDRMLTQLVSSGRLRRVKALIGGSLRGCGRLRERDRRWRQLLLESAPAGVPVVVGLPFGHGAANMAFPIGVTVEVDTRAGHLTWSR